MSGGESFAAQRTDRVRVLQRFGFATSPLSRASLADVPEQQVSQPAALPPIEAPRSWNKHDREIFSSLPADVITAKAGRQRR